MPERWFGSASGLFHLRNLGGLKNKLFHALIENDVIKLSGHRDDVCYPEDDWEFYIKPERVDGGWVDALGGHARTLTLRCKLIENLGSSDEIDCVLFLVHSDVEECCTKTGRIKRGCYYLIRADPNVPCLNLSQQDRYNIDRMKDDS